MILPAGSSNCERRPICRATSCSRQARFYCSFNFIVSRRGGISTEGEKFFVGRFLARISRPRGSQRIIKPNWPIVCSHRGGRLNLEALRNRRRLRWRNRGGNRAAFVSCSATKTPTTRCRIINWTADYTHRRGTGKGRATRAGGAAGRRLIVRCRDATTRGAAAAPRTREDTCFSFFFFLAADQQH